MRLPVVCLWVLAVSVCLVSASHSASAHPQRGEQAGPPRVGTDQAGAPSSKGLTQAQRERLRPRLRGYQDPARAAVGAVALAQLERRLGSVAGVKDGEELSDVVPLWDVVPGVHFEALFTPWAMVNTRSEGEEPLWRPHHRTPVFGRYLPSGDGYRIEESVKAISQNPPRYAPSYSRVVRQGERAWIEQGDLFGRGPSAIEKVRAETLRDVGLLWFPLGLRALDAQLAALEPTEGSALVGEDEAEETLLYELRYGPTLRLLDHEWTQEFFLVLDRTTGLPRQIRYHVTHHDRVHMRTPVQWVNVDFDVWQQVPIPEDVRAAWGERVRAQWQAAHPEDTWDEARLHLPRAVELPAGITIWRPETRLVLHVEVVRQGFGGLDPDSLRLPWQHENVLWRTSERASYWDAPPKAPEGSVPATGEPAEAPPGNFPGPSQGD